MSNRELSNCQSTPPFRLLFATSVLDAERSEIERKTRRGPTRQGLPAVAARGSDHRGTVCLSTPHAVFAIAARCVLLFHASRHPPKSIKNGPFPCEKGPFPVLRRRAQKVSSTSSAAYISLRHFRNPVGGYEGCISAAFSEAGRKSGCKPSHPFARQNVKRLGKSLRALTFIGLWFGAYSAGSLK